MPANRLWNTRRPLYKATLIVLMAVAPLNMLSLVLPYWLQTKVVISRKPSDPSDVTDISLTYGIWTLCAETFGCRDVHNSGINAGVGGWLYAIKLFMVASVLCHLCAVLCGAVQNFLPRQMSRRWRAALWKKVVHRDCPYTEDIGFVSGFLGHMSCIIFMVGTKDQMSNGAQYQWAFAFAFMSSSLTVVATLALTKSHILAAPRPTQARQPTNNEPPREPPREPAREPATEAVFSGAAMRQEVRPDDVYLTERGDGAGATHSGEMPTSRASFSRRRWSRSRSPSRERRSSSRSRQTQSRSFQSRLVRSRELENIPAAVTPSTSGSVPTAPDDPQVQRSSRNPIMCLQMSDLENRAASLPEMMASGGGGGGVGGWSSSVKKTALPLSAGKKDCEHPVAGSSLDRLPECSVKVKANSQAVQFKRTRSEANVQLPRGACSPGNNTVDASHEGESACEGASPSDNRVTVRL